MTTEKFKKPDFLGHMFVAHGLGFSMAADPPMDLLDTRFLNDENPWIVLAALIQRAKQGDFSNMAHIFKYLRLSEGDGAYWHACLITLAHAAPSSVLKQLLNEFHSEIWEKRDLLKIEYVVDILSQSLRLWIVPILLNIFLEIGDRKEIDEIDEYEDNPSLILIPDYLSQLLEEEYASIAEAESFDSDEEYREYVTQTYEQKCREMGSPEVAILKGKLFTIRSVAEQLLTKVMAVQVDALEVAKERMLFEATTGVNCNAFFVDFKIQRLAAASILEEFLESSYAEQYEPGVRYFFGHRIPD